MVLYAASCVERFQRASSATSQMSWRRQCKMSHLGSCDVVELPLLIRKKQKRPFRRACASYHAYWNGAVSDRFWPDKDNLLRYVCQKQWSVTEYVIIANFETLWDFSLGLWRVSSICQDYFKESNVKDACLLYCGRKFTLIFRLLLLREDNFSTLWCMGRKELVRNKMRVLRKHFIY